MQPESPPIVPISEESAPTRAQEILVAPTKRLSASAFISYPHEESATAQTLEQILVARKWAVARDRNMLRYGENLEDQLATLISANSFLLAVVSRASENSGFQKQEIEHAKLLRKPIIPIVLVDWEAMPKTAFRLQGFLGISLIDKDAAAQNQEIVTLLNGIERDILAT